MKAKEYLSQIRHMDILINAYIHQKDEMWRQLRSLSSPQYDGISIQRSRDYDKFGEMWARIDEKERQITKQIDRLVDAKKAITKEISMIDDDRYVEILLRRYVQMQKLEQIAVDMNYSYDRVRHMHGLALLEFTRVHPHIQYVSTQ